MKYLFEVNTTFCKPFYIYVDENTIVEDFIEDIIIHVETRTEYIRDDIIDIFVQDLSGLMSIPRLNMPLNEFMKDHPDYFHQWAGALNRNIHKVYIMDKQYLKDPKINKEEIEETLFDIKQLVKFLIPII